MIKIDKVKCVYCNRVVLDYGNLVVVNGDQKKYAHLKCMENRIKDNCKQSILFQYA